MDRDEIIAARNALQQWFVSQEIDISKGRIVMASLIASSICGKGRDMAELENLYGAFLRVLAVEIADQIHE